MRSGSPGPRANSSTPHRRTVRSIAAAVSAAIALVYVLIGVGTLRVLEPGADPSLLAFGLSAGAAFAAGAILLVAVDRRVVWVLGAALQVIVIAMYFVVAPQRTPPYETWGVALKVAQAVLLVALAFLATSSTAEARPRRA